VVLGSVLVASAPAAGQTVTVPGPPATLGQIAPSPSPSAPPAARAQTPSPAGGDARPVTGSAGFNGAPMLEPGRWADTILPGETLFYAVRLAPGQRLRVEAAVDIVVGGEAEDPVTGASGLVNANLYSPLRQRVVQGLGGGATQPMAELRSEPIAPFDQAVSASGSAPYTGPGTYYVGVDVGELVTGQERFIELPLDLDVSVSGAPGKDLAQAIDPVQIKATSDEVGEDPGSGAPATGAGGSTGPSPGVLAGGGLAGLAAGALLGAMAVRRRSPPPR